MFNFFTLNCSEFPTSSINWQAWIPAIISLIAAIIIAVISYKTNRKLLNYKNTQEHQMDDKKYMRELIFSLINEVDIRNIGNTKIEILWQIVQKIRLFVDKQNISSESLCTVANGFIKVIENWQIAENTCKTAPHFIKQAKDSFNASKEEFEEAVNKYFSYYTQKTS
jgi:hypothetical protein